MEEPAGAILVASSLSHVEATDPYVTGIDSTQVWRDSQRMEGSAWLKGGRTPALERVGVRGPERVHSLAGALNLAST